MFDAPAMRLRERIGVKDPIAAAVRPDVGPIDAGVAGDEDELVRDRVDCKAAVLTGWRSRGCVRLRPGLRLAVPDPEVVLIALRLLGTVDDQFQAAEEVRPAVGRIHGHLRAVT